MEHTQLIAKQIRDVYTGGNWTCVNLEELLGDVTQKEALTVIPELNTVATLTYHIHYYAVILSNVLQGFPLDGKDEYSFNHPAFTTDKEWKDFVDEVIQTGKHLSELTEQLPDNQLTAIFSDEKYGTYYRNIAGFTEHTHYHMGQIALVKKLIRSQIAAK